MELRFRPTVWPGTPVPVPRVLARSEILRDGPWILQTGDLRSLEVPQEVYLRQFRDTPDDDLDALAELFLLGDMRPLVKGKWGPVKRHDLDLPPTSSHEGYMTARHFGSKDWVIDESERWEMQQKHAGVRAVQAVHVAEAAIRVWYVQRCTEHVLAYLAGEPVAPTWRFPLIRDEETAWRYFAGITDPALRDFHVRVRPPDAQGHDVLTTLYSAAMLQLVNDLASGETVHACANETCGRPFIRQLGRSEHGGHRRTGTLYCSSNCARAQYQREKRRRDRAAQKG